MSNNKTTDRDEMYSKIYSFQPAKDISENTGGKFTGSLTREDNKEVVGFRSEYLAMGSDGWFQVVGEDSANDLSIVINIDKDVEVGEHAIVPFEEWVDGAGIATIGALRDGTPSSNTRGSILILQVGDIFEASLQFNCNFESMGDFTFEGQVFV